jgi:hypothetical protein
VTAEHSHLQMIQAVITRLSTQSTTIKGWCVTVTAALLGFGANATSPLISIVALYVVAAFALLDAYYLTLERAHRALYARAVDDTAKAWSLTVDRPTVRGTLDALRSPSIALLYGTSLVTAMAVAVYTGTR